MKKPVSRNGRRERKPARDREVGHASAFDHALHRDVVRLEAARHRRRHPAGIPRAGRPRVPQPYARPKALREHRRYPPGTCASCRTPDEASGPRDSRSTHPGAAPSPGRRPRGYPRCAGSAVRPSEALRVGTACPRGRGRFRCRGSAGREPRRPPPPAPSRCRRKSPNHRARERSVPPRPAPGCLRARRLPLRTFAGSAGPRPPTDPPRRPTTPGRTSLERPRRSASRQASGARRPPPAEAGRRQLEQRSPQPGHPSEP